MPKELKSFGKSMKELRKLRGLTQDQLAEKCGYHPVFVSKIERGVQAPSFEGILKIAGALEVLPGDLLNSAVSEFSLASNTRREIATILTIKEESELKVFLAFIKAYGKR